jgi:hypothetical protein
MQMNGTGQGAGGQAAHVVARGLDVLCERVRDHETALLLLVDRQLRQPGLEAQARVELEHLRRKLHLLAGAVEKNLTRLEGAEP